MPKWRRSSSEAKATCHPLPIVITSDSIHYTKLYEIPVKFMPDADEPVLPKPDWMRIRLPASGEKIQAVKNIMRRNNFV